MDDRTTLAEGMSKEEAVATFSRTTVAMVLTNPRLPDNPIVYVNQAFERMTGYSSSAAVGQNCRFLQGKGTDPKLIQQLRRGIESATETSVDILNYRSNGEPFMNRLIISPILSDQGDCHYFMGMQKEMREGEAVTTSLDRQLEEIQHRVKNHLSMIIGMIRAQSRQSKAPDEFKTLARRIESLQLLYEEMSHAGGNVDSLALGTYLTRVANAIAHLDGRPGVRVAIDVAPIDAPVEVATRVGLCLSEVMTNALQHAFEGRREGVVDVRMAVLTQGGIRLTIADDGVGIPPDIQWPAATSLGGRIVQGLIEGLGGTIVVGRGATGTMITIEVPEWHHRDGDSRGN